MLHPRSVSEKVAKPVGRRRRRCVRSSLYSWKTPAAAPRGEREMCGEATQYGFPRATTTTFVAYETACWPSARDCPTRATSLTRATSIPKLIPASLLLLYSLLLGKLLNRRIITLYILARRLVYMHARVIVRCGGTLLGWRNVCKSWNCSEVNERERDEACFRALSNNALLSLSLSTLWEMFNRSFACILMGECAVLWGVVAREQKEFRVEAKRIPCKMRRDRKDCRLL